MTTGLNVLECETCDWKGTEDKTIKVHDYDKTIIVEHCPYCDATDFIITGRQSVI
ncbi:hypothetical protein [Psychrobacillus psychrodurans]|uniref:hypothetical protein n=1 Tax=Psychrobacillus psychrodurans TaxID=126157 RepID=UPI003D01F690